MIYVHRWKAMDLGFNLAQSNRDLKDPTSRQNFGDTSGLLCKNDLIPCLNTISNKEKGCRRQGATSCQEALGSYACKWRGTYPFAGEDNAAPPHSSSSDISSNAPFTCVLR